MDWKRFGALPYGSRDILDEPHYVYGVFQACETAIDSHRDYASLQAQKPKAPTSNVTAFPKAVGGRRYG